MDYNAWYGDAHYHRNYHGIKKPGGHPPGFYFDYLLRLEAVELLDEVVGIDTVDGAGLLQSLTVGSGAA